MSAGVDRFAAAALLAGFTALYGPSWWDFLFGSWASYSQGHELLVLVAAAYLAWRRRMALAHLPVLSGSNWPAKLLLFSGLAMYFVGRTQQFLRVELLSQWLAIAALLLHFKGGAGLRLMLAPLVALLFAMPLPYSWVLALTGPLKLAVSQLTVAGLQILGYPVGRYGVVIAIGHYRLLVAEACAGLQTVFALEAFSFFYTQLMDYRSWQRGTLMALMVVPVGFAANVVRTSTLVLVTYHFGDQVGQGFVHGFAGVLLFAVALALIHLLDLVFSRVLPATWD